MNHSAILACATTACLGLAAAAMSAGDELPVEQQAIGSSYDRLEAAALRLSESLAETDPARSQQLRDVVRSARESQVADRFDRVVAELEKERLAAAARGQLSLSQTLEGLLSQLSADPRSALLKKRAEWARRLAAEVENLEQRQRELLGRNSSESSSEEGLPSKSEQQQQLSAEAGRLAKAAQNDPLSSESQTRGSPAKPLQQAADKMRSSADQLGKGNASRATEEQTEAIEALKEARRRLEETLRQIREEEELQRLAGLAERFREMLQRQEPINDQTLDLESQSQALSRSVRRTYQDLAGEQRSVVEIAEATGRLIAEEDSSVAMAFAVEEVSDLLSRAASNLEAYLADQRVIDMQLEATDLLKDLEQAVERDLDSRRSQGSAQSQNGRAQEDRLTNAISDLKMLRRLQGSLMRRSQGVRPEQAAELARRQRRIAEATRSVIRQLQ